MRFSVYANTVAHHQFYPNLQLIAYDAWHMLKKLVSLHWCMCKNDMLRLYAYNPPTPCRTQACETVRALSYRLLSSLLTQLAVSRPLTVRCPSRIIGSRTRPLAVRGPSRMIGSRTWPLAVRGPSRQRWVNAFIVLLDKREPKGQQRV